MSVAELLINVMGPVVLIVAVGWFAGSKLAFDVATLSRLAFWVLGPAFVFDVFFDADLQGDIAIRLLVAALAGMAAGAALGLAAAGPLGIRGARRDGVTMTSAYGNVGNAGLAISVFAFGDSAVPAAALLMVIINISGILLGVALASARTEGIGPAVRRSLSAPMTIAAAISLLVNAFDVSVPLVAERAIGLGAGALIPVMLLTLGMQLAQNGAPGPSRDIGLVGMAKLVVAPLVAGLVGWSLGLDGETQGVLILQSAMPPAVFCAVVALEYDMDPERVSRTVVGTTLLALATLPVALLLVT